MTSRSMARGAKAFAGALLISSICIAFPTAAGAANAWVRRAAPSPSADYNQIQAVSCVNETNCVGVGTYLGATGFKSLIVRTTDGINWTRSPAPSPGGLLNILLDVDCTTATACTAVGTYASRGDLNEPDLRTLVLRTTNGTTWARITSPNPGGIPSSLEGVSCVTATKCRAVGDFGGNSLIIITSNGTNWFRQESPNRGDGANYLLSVDCETTSSCTAVGLYFNRPLDSEHARSLVLRSTDARTWIPVASPNPSPGTSDTYLNDVSCVGTTCTAVGELLPSPGTKRSFILRSVNGGAWTRAATPTATGEVELRSVDCPSANECTAVGIEWNPANTLFTSRLLRTTNGTTWASPSPTSEKLGHRPNGVSCPTPVKCMAVGGFNATGNPDDTFKSLVLRET
jgi:hypothetical protein